MEHIFILDTSRLRNEDIFRRQFHRMPLERQQKITRHKQENDRLRSLGAGIVLHVILRQYGLESALVKFEYGANGKACVAGRPDIHFNLTHSGNYAAGVCGVSPVGIDVETIGKMNERTAKRFFHDREYQYLESAEDPQEKCQRFFRLWVLKESFMKVTGLGMKLPLNAFEIRIQGENIEVVQNVDEKQYYFKEFVLEGSRMAVCSADRTPAGWEPVWIKPDSIL